MGVGDVLPLTDLEIIVCMVIEISGPVVLPLLIGTLMSILENAAVIERELDDLKSNVAGYIAEHPAAFRAVRVTRGVARAESPRMRMYSCVCLLLNSLLCTCIRICAPLHCISAFASVDPASMHV